LETRGFAAPHDADLAVRRRLGPQLEVGTRQMTSAKAALDSYFDKIDRRVPLWVSQLIRWLRKPSSLIVRWLIALLLIVGGVFSFLPVLGLWMLPLGLLFIAQDVPILQKPLVAALAWIEAKWERLRAALRRKP
jgi:hypothetical protein